MSRMMVRYKVKPDQVARNEELVRDVYAELAREQPDGLRYGTFRLDDGVSFVHVVSVETADGSNPLPSLPAFQRFVDAIADRLDEGPVTSDLTEIGSYRFVGE
ncbi:MAG TPA: hypothetical protein VGN59_17365 [Acidimicrobiia bacterium]|jgi:hypothetical protein